MDLRYIKRSNLKRGNKNAVLNTHPENNQKRTSTHVQVWSDGWDKTGSHRAGPCL